MVCEWLAGDRRTRDGVADLAGLGIAIRAAALAGWPSDFPLSHVADPQGSAASALVRATRRSPCLHASIVR